MNLRKKAFKAVLLSAVAGWAFAAAAEDTTLYTISNSPNGNSVAVVKQGNDGKLRVAGRYSTGGVGPGVGLAVPSDPLGTQNPIIMSDDKRFLIVPNASTNSISVFRIAGDTLVLTSVTPSGGDYPVGFAMRGPRLYVVNGAGRTGISQLVLLPNGRLLPVPERRVDFPTVSASLGAQPHVLDSPGQIQFSPDGRWLVSTDKNAVAGHGSIVVYPVDREGLLGKPVVTPLDEPAPFGFTFDARGHLLVTLPLTGFLASYAIGDDGKAKLISAVANQQPTACWIDGRGGYYYSTNTLADSISGYSVGDDGKLKLLNENGVAAALGTNAQPIEVRVSNNGERLYTVAAGTGRIEAFRINRKTGALTDRQSVQVFGGFTGMTGLVVR